MSEEIVILAVTVMGWVRPTTQSWTSKTWCLPSARDLSGMNPKAWYILEKDYDPLNNVTQAMELLDQMHESFIHTTTHFTDCSVYKKGLLVGRSKDKIKSTAITNAVLKAIGYIT